MFAKDTEDTFCKRKTKKILYYPMKTLTKLNTWRSPSERAQYHSNLNGESMVCKVFENINTNLN